MEEFYGYHVTFTATGANQVNEILVALADACHGSHHTGGWRENGSLDEIQAAAVRAAMDHAALEAENAALRERLAAAEAHTALTNEQIKAIAINYGVHVGGESYSDSYDVTRYECAEDFFNCVRAILAASAAPAAQEDAKRLDFMIQQEAWISWSKDGESCRVFHSDADGEARPFMGWGFTKAWHHDARPAIDAAIAANTPKGTLE